MLQTKATVSKWGNSQALRIPIEMARQLGICVNDEVIMEIIDGILIVAKPTTPKKGTIEYLFKDYTGGIFKTELTNPIEPIGKEKW